MSALARAKAEIDEIKSGKSQALRRVRDKAKDAAQANEHTLLAGASAWGIGVLERKGTKLPTIKDIDPKLLYGIAGLIGAYMSKDQRQKRILQSVGDGMIGAWAYVQGRKAPGASGVSGYGSEILGESSEEDEDGEI